MGERDRGKRGEGEMGVRRGCEGRGAERGENAEGREGERGEIGREG